jgi:hypothetical protein
MKPQPLDYAPPGPRRRFPWWLIVLLIVLAAFAGSIFFGVA